MKLRHRILLAVIHFLERFLPMGIDDRRRLDMLREDEEKARAARREELELMRSVVLAQKETIDTLLSKLELVVSASRDSTVASVLASMKVHGDATEERAADSRPKIGSFYINASPELDIVDDNLKKGTASSEKVTDDIKGDVEKLKSLLKGGGNK